MPLLRVLRSIPSAGWLHRRGFAATSGVDCRSRRVAIFRYSICTNMGACEKNCAIIPVNSPDTRNVDNAVRAKALLRQAKVRDFSHATQREFNQLGLSGCRPAGTILSSKTFRLPN
jgi:hypothetical protein